MTLTAGTAGLGVPRGSLSNLNHLNHEVVKNGSAQVRPAPQFSASAPSRSSGSSAPQHGSMSSAPMAHTSSSGRAAAPSTPSHR